jgi:hypothetical protein
MKRGGKRQGAGRKKKHPIRDEIKIGSYCEGLWLKEVARKEAEASAAATAKVRVEWAKVNSIPLKKRGEHIKVVQGKSRVISDAMRTHQEDVDNAIKEDRGDPQSVKRFKRIVSIPVERPYGVKAAIRAKAAKKFRTTDKQVRNSWQTFRKFRARLVRDLNKKV